MIQSPMEELQMSKTLLAVAVGLVLTTMRITAHHAFAAEYDEHRRVTVSGTGDRLQVDQSACMVVCQRDR